MSANLLFDLFGAPWSLSGQSSRLESSVWPIWRDLTEQIGAGGSL
jgi:hypothetical protein